MSAAPAPHEQAAAAEAWFMAHGLPWFPEGESRRVREVLAWRRARRVVAAAVGLGVLAGAAAGVLGQPSDGLPAALLAALACLGLYAARALGVGAIARWAGRRAGRSLRLLLPLATRALPLLLIFTVFFFVNAEVWEVAAAMPRGVLALVVAVFAALGVLFLLARLPEEVDRVGQDATGDRLVAACAGTPVEAEARRLAGAGERAPERPLSREQRANLLVVLLVAQAVQVVLLSAAVLGFFVVFGVLAVTPEIASGWTGDDVALPLSPALLKVSVFLTAFSGLYFTVAAVTDATYREEFFTTVTRELERAVGVRAAYLSALARTGDGPGGGTRA